MLGAILGDIIGSIYEFDNIKTKDFPLFTPYCIFTDDTVMTVAVAEALMECGKDIPLFKVRLVELMHKYGKLYPRAGYGGRFRRWLMSGDTKPYGSFGNGSAMRVSPVALYAESLDEALALAKASAEVTHDHPEGIKGAVATAGAIYLARKGADKETIRTFIEGYYDLSFTIDAIRPFYKFNETCQGSVPEALLAFLESDSYTDTIRTAISIGGDSDTIAAIAGGVAEAFYGIPKSVKERAFHYLDTSLSRIVKEFYKNYCA